MYLSNTFLIFLKYFLISTVTASPFEDEGKIIGGIEASPHSHPYLVSLQTKFLWVRMHVCGGAILNRRWILTAGHCALESWLIRWLPLDAVAGLHEVNHYRDSAQVMKIRDRIPHPLYEGGIGPYDIALFRTEYPFTFNKYIKPVALPKSGKYENHPLKIAGWGALRTTLFIPDLPNRLREVKVTFVPYDKCFRAIENLKEDGENNPLNREANICTGPTTGGIAACNGDSGGPLIQYLPSIIAEPNDHVEQNTEKYNASYYNCTNEETTTEAAESNDLERVNLFKDNKINQEKRNKESKEEVAPVVIGIVSWGVAPCGERGAPTVYTNVWTYIDFINYYITKNEYNGIQDYGDHKDLNLKI